MLADMSPLWEGVFCALWTPTDKNGELIESALKDNIEFLKPKGIQGLLVMGSTGEFLHLKPNRRKDMLERTVEMAAPLPFMMNISDIRPAVVISLARFAKRMGAAAVSILPPYFYSLTQEDLVEFFVQAGEAAELPVFLYNFPERTGNRIALETIAAVADRIPLAGVKQSGNEFEYHSQLAELGKKKGFVVLTGSDTRLPEAIGMGAAGCVSGLSNAVPEIIVEAFLATRQGSGTSSAAINHAAELGRRVPVLNFPLNMAACMEARGLVVGRPKSIVSESTRQRYTKFVDELRELFREWKLI